MPAQQFDYAGWGAVPVGGIIPWAKNIAATALTLPEEFALCDGSAVSDTDSPFNGQNTPNLNSGNKFLRGATSSGGTGGSATHSHNIPTRSICAGTLDFVNVAEITSTDSASSLPPYYEVVWIIRIK